MRHWATTTLRSIGWSSSLGMRGSRGSASSRSSRNCAKIRGSRISCDSSSSRRATAPPAPEQTTRSKARRWQRSLVPALSRRGSASRGRRRTPSVRRSRGRRLGRVGREAAIQSPAARFGTPLGRFGNLVSGPRYQRIRSERPLRGRSAFQRVLNPRDDSTRDHAFGRRGLSSRVSNQGRCSSKYTWAWGSNCSGSSKAFK